MSYYESSSIWLTSLVQSFPFFVPILWMLYMGKGSDSVELEQPIPFNHQRRRAKVRRMALFRKLVGIILMLSLGALMPSFLFMGWSRDARAVDELFDTSTALTSLHFNGSSYMYRNLSRGPARLQDVIIFGETERGVDLESQGWEEVKRKRDVIKQVGSTNMVITWFTFVQLDK